jgi:ketosteroid isomerase-like protein
MTDTATSNTQIVRSGYQAFGRGDMAALAERFAPDAVWTHRNGGRFAGPKHGFDAIMAFYGESVELSAGTLRVEPTDLLGDADSVAVLVHMTATRPDGRVLDDRQVHLFQLRDGKTVAVDQYVGDPAAVEAFWA